MRLRWLRGARGDVRHIGLYIALESPDAARRITTRIIEAIDLLTDQQGIGRPGRIIGTRELAIGGTPYRAAYRVRGENTVEIIAVIHGMQRWPESFEKRLGPPHRPRTEPT